MVGRLSVKPGRRLRQASHMLFPYLECPTRGVWDYSVQEAALSLSENKKDSSYQIHPLLQLQDVESLSTL